MNMIRISDISIPIEFSNSKPKERKLSKVRAYVEEHGELDKPVVLDNKILTDNYIRYLIAIEKGFEEIPYITTQEYQESILQKSTYYIIGKFRDSAKEYTWKNPKNIPINVGDRVLVKSKSVNGKKNRGVVTVVKIFSSNNKRFLKHKPVIKNLNAIKEK